MLHAASAWAGPSLADRYHDLVDGTRTALPGTRTAIASSERDEVPRAEVDSILRHPFDQVAPALARAENWCLFMPLHFNVKACTSETAKGETVLTLYSGRKHYQTPEESYRIAYRFAVIRQDEDLLSIRLHADTGPANTHDYRIALDALRVEEGTLLHIDSSFHPSTLSSLLSRAYLATLGRDKVGFSRIEEEGEWRLVQGERGVIERNVMRYQLAIDAFLGTRELPDAAQHEAALKNWFRLNDSYPQQLHEMPEDEYLAAKRREWVNQQRLQQALNDSLRLAATPELLAVPISGRIPVPWLSIHQEDLNPEESPAALH